jgi:YVTN family beta-propeller protein/autotransporter-associated beta strand protein
MMTVAPHAARAQQGPFAYVPNFGNNNLTVIDTPTNAVSPTTIPVGSSPVAAAVRGDESLVYVTNSGSNTVSVIDTATNTTVATIPVGNAPQLIAVSADGTRAYVANALSDTVSVINTATNSVTATIAIAPGAQPVGVGVTPDGGRVYVTNQNANTVSVINTATNTVIATIAVGNQPSAVTVTPDGTRAYVSNFNSFFNGTVSVINTVTNAVIDTIPLGVVAGPQVLAVSPNGSRVYVANNSDSNVFVIDTATNAVIATITVGLFPIGVIVTPDGTRVYVTNTNNTVSVIDTATNTVVATLPAGSQPFALGICSNGNALLAAGLTFKANTSGALTCTLASGPTGSPGPVFTGGTLQFAGANISSTLPISLQSAGGIFDTNGNNATLAGTISGPGGLTKIGAGTLTLSGSGTYTGATSVNAGTLQSGAVNAFSPFSAFTVASGATLNLASFNQTIGSLAGAGSVTLGSATLTSGNDNTNTMFSGTISGSGRLTKIGSGTFVLTGDNTYTGGTTISAGTLQLGNGGTTGSIIGNVVDNSIFAINRSDTFTFGGAISGTGAFQQSGPGTTILSGDNTYTGTTAVNAGTLVVNGSIANSAVTVNAGATLAGNGTVGPTAILSDGTFAPGTMTVAGNLAFQSGALYLVQLNPSVASSTNVTGTASLAGTVVVLLSSGFVRSSPILFAAGGLGGTTFDAVRAVNLPADFSASLSYTATSVELDLTAALGQGAGLSQNQQNIANALNNFFNSGGTLPANFLSLFNLSGANLGNALSQLSGEAATGAQQAGFQMGSQFLGQMLDPFVDGRSGVGGAGGPALGFAPEREELPDDIALAYSKVLKAPKAPAVPTFEQRWTTWGGAYGGSNRTSGDPAVLGSHDLSASTAGFAGGLDYHLTRDSVVGFALAGGGTNWSLAQGLGGGKSDAFQAGVYSATRSGPAYLAAAFAYTNHWMSTDRFAFAGDHLTASFNAQSYGGRVESGYRFATWYGGVTPYAAIQAQSFHTPGYSETDTNGGGFALAFNSRTATDIRSELGARFDRLVTFNRSAALALWARLAWAHDWVSDPTLTPLFQVLPGASFIVTGATPAKNSALASAGTELRLANGITLLAKFDGDFASHSSTYAGTGTVRYTW